MLRRNSSEFALLLACCRWPSSGHEIADRSVGVNWAKLVQLSARHRVEGIVWRALVAAGIELPLAISMDLSATASRIAHQNLNIAAESLQLQRLLKHAKVSAIFVKGVTLGKLAYGDIARKAGWDIDVLVESNELDPATAVLRGRGYKLITPSTKRAAIDLPRWHQHAKESVWQSADGSIWVELHTSLTDNPMLLPGIGTSSPRREVEVSPGMFLVTLEHDELFAYLCVHGASSAWFRLKWITDLTALISQCPTAEIERLYRNAIKLGAGRAAAQALLLADVLFGLALSSKFRDELRSDWVSRWLTAIALRKLTGRAGEVELDQVMLGTASIHVAQLALLPGWRFKWSEVTRQLINPISRLASAIASSTH